MPAPLIPRDEAIDRLLEVFQRLGYDGASLAELSRGTGLGKSSLYQCRSQSNWVSSYKNSDVESC